MNEKENRILQELKEIKQILRDLQYDMGKVKEKLNTLSPDTPVLRKKYDPELFFVEDHAKK